ncbi:hypothetical protein PROFUN_01662 [Planoprotostelium fungivorum]|uniref:Uncharacterized protein n=1 Tax=Planoprotostelium fungivorum TaxID=1890364 RepID=A0A2P6MWC2_9EUKA|nr:hypothetical protein PROFUN_01662 [Planoprotostelium fungivorum]
MSRILFAVLGFALLVSADTTNNILNGSPVTLLKNGILNGVLPQSLTRRSHTENNILNASPVGGLDEGILNGLPLSGLGGLGGFAEKRQQPLGFLSGGLLRDTPVNFLGEGVLTQGVLNGARLKRDLSNNILNGSPFNIAQNGVAIGRPFSPFFKRQVMSAVEAVFNAIDGESEDFKRGISEDTTTNFLNGSPVNAEGLRVENVQVLSNNRYGFPSKRSSTTNNVLNGSPINLVQHGVANGLFSPVEGLLSQNKRSPFGDVLTDGLLRSLFRGKGIAATTSYGSRVYVHADIAANIAIDIPTQNGLLSSLSSIAGGIVSLGNLVSASPSSTAFLSIKADADVTVNIGIAADLKVTLPAGCFPLYTSDSLFGSAQLGVRVQVEGEANVAAALVTPVLDASVGPTKVGILKVIDSAQSTFASLPVAVEAGRIVAHLGDDCNGIYIFVGIQTN